MAPPWIATFEMMEKAMGKVIDHFHHGIMSDSITEDSLSSCISLIGTLAMALIVKLLTLSPDFHRRSSALCRHRASGCVP
jgi:hypothetical protein